ncbi:hypothetical protein VNI00_005483 [Paramarasmius palmivorus]|uniref:Uncharacterized protein n=1 Tax=Paramarasmius palmivorus TaxID=297713 RepID=A0AAW0DGK7_9AGAR
MRDPFIPDRKLFPSTHSALKLLETLGNPPQSPDISNPSTQCQSALDILAFLSYHNTTPWDKGTYFSKVVLKHWSSYIAAWFQCFLGQYVLDEEAPSTERGLVFRDRIVSVLPDLVAFGNSPEEQANRLCILLRSQGQFLIPLMAQTWLKLTEVYHSAARRWTSLFLYALQSKDPKLTEEIDTSFRSTHRDVAGLGIREMLHFASSCRLSTLKPDALPDFEVFMIIITPSFRLNSPHHPSFLARGGIAALVKVTWALLSRPTLARYLNGRSGCSGIGLIIAKICLTLLRNCADYPSSAFEALQAGLLKIIVKAAPYYNDGQWFDDDQIERNLGEILGDVLERVSRLLVYPSVIRRFTRSVEKYVTKEWEKSLEKSHEFLSKVWKSCLDNLDHIKRIRSGLKEQGSGLCDFVDGTSMPGPIEVAIFLKIVGNYVHKFGEEITEQLKVFEAAIKLFYKDEVHPILVLEFDLTVMELNLGHQLMEFSRFDIVDRDRVVRDARLLPGNRERIMEYTSSSHRNDPLELVVVAFFPGLLPLIAWSVVMVVNIPGRR